MPLTLSCLSNARNYEPAVSFRRLCFFSRDPKALSFGAPGMEVGSARNHRPRLALLSARHSEEDLDMKKTLAALGTVAALATTTVAAPAQARGIGPGVAFGLAAGALTAGAIAASHPYYYGAGYPGYYGYYGPRYYSPGYAYYGGPYYHRHYYRHYW